MNGAIEEIKRLCQDENIIGLYDAEAVARKEMNSRLVYAEQQEMEQGIEHGMEIVAKNMLRKNMDIAIITEVTGLTKTQVEELNVA